MMSKLKLVEAQRNGYAPESALHDKTFLATNQKIKTNNDNISLPLPVTSTSRDMSIWWFDKKSLAPV